MRRGRGAFEKSVAACATRVAKIFVARTQDRRIIRALQAVKPRLLRLTGGNTRQFLPLTLRGDKTLNDKQRRIIERGARVSAFGTANAADFPANGRGGELFSKLSAELANLDTLEVVKATSVSTRQQGSAGRRDLRESLRAQVAAVSDTARVIATEHAELKGKFQYSRTDRGDRSLIAVAHSFAEAAPPFKTLFVAYELPADFIERMNADASALEQQMVLQTQGVGARVTTNASIDQGLERIDDYVDKLDVIVHNKYREDPAKLAAWESARRLERAARAKRNGGAQKDGGTPTP